MKPLFYPRLALGSISKNKRMYVPYIISCTGMVAVFYIIHYLAAMRSLDYMPGGGSTARILGFGVWTVAVFALLFLAYTDKFLLKRRQREYGIYSVLGMSKRNIARVYACETVMLLAFSLVVGTAIGILLSKAAELALVRLIGGDVSYIFYISEEATYDTFLIFGIIFFALFVRGMISVIRMNPLSLMKSESAGDKPPRANYLFAVIGSVILIGAYIIALSIKNPILAVAWFFVAVLMVIFGTYMLFIFGSVVLCRLLKKNKKYYYNPRHFVSVSSMSFRMKRNGAGLASICILLTTVTVIATGTGSLFFGKENILNSSYKRGINVSINYASDEDEASYTPEKVQFVKDKINAVAEKSGLNREDVLTYVYDDSTALLRGRALITDREEVNKLNTSNADDIRQVYYLSLDDYNSVAGSSESLGNDEVIVYSAVETDKVPELILADGTVLKIKKYTDEPIVNPSVADQVTPTFCIISSDPKSLYEHAVNDTGSSMFYKYCPKLIYCFDVSSSSAQAEIQLADDIREELRMISLNDDELLYGFAVSSKEKMRANSFGTFGGIFYLGIILSIVFIAATVLIIYYKQVTEGYEDEKRFKIMQNIGMTERDIKKNVNSQMLTVFMLPFAAAICHFAFAYPMIRRLLYLFSLSNDRLTLAVSALSIAVFALLYTAVYKLTSNTYVAIVSRHGK